MIVGIAGENTRNRFVGCIIRRNRDADHRIRRGVRGVNNVARLGFCKLEISANVGGLISAGIQGTGRKLNSQTKSSIGTTRWKSKIVSTPPKTVVKVELAILPA